jgi:PPP family 3-phenylpropionic acid transporter
MRALRIVVLALGAGLGVIFPFISVILESRGFDAGAIGLITALGAVALTVAVAIWGHVADVILGRPRTLILCAAAAGVSIGSLLAPIPTVVVSVAFIAFWFFVSGWQPLADAISVNVLADRPHDYGRIRVLTSATFAFGALGAGVVYDAVGYGPAPVLFIAAALLVALGSLTLPDVERADLARHAIDRRSAPEARTHRTWRLGSVGVAIRLEPRVLLLLLAVALVHVGILGNFTFLPLRIVELGGTPGDVAIASGGAALAEIPAMLLAAGVAKRIGLRGVFVGSAVLYAACMASWAVTDVIGVILATRVLAGVAFAGLVVSIVLSIGALLPADLQATGQALYQTVAFGLAAVVGNAMGGLVYGGVGPEAFFVLVAVLAVAGAAIGAAAVPSRTSRAAATLAPRVG